MRDRGTKRSIINKNIDYPWCYICDRKKAAGSHHDKSGNRICINCYQKFVYSKYKQKMRYGNSKRNPEHSLKRILFLGKRVVIYGVLRKGECSECKKRIGDPYIDFNGRPAIIKQTQMHHWFYLIIMPWACTTELCTPCHCKRNRNRKK